MAFTALGGFLGWFLGGVDGFLYALIAFVVIDYLTGVMCAINDHTLSSAVGFRGICRKVLIYSFYLHPKHAINSSPRCKCAPINNACCATSNSSS